MARHGLKWSWEFFPYYCRRINLAFIIYVCETDVFHCRRSIVNSAMLLHTRATQSTSTQHRNGRATCSTHHHQMSFREYAFADFRNTSKYYTAGHLLDTLSSSWTAKSCKYCTAGHLLDTLSSSWTLAGQASFVNIALLDICWTHCPAAGH